MRRELGMFVALVLLCLGLWATNHDFLGASNVVNTTRQISMLGTRGGADASPLPSERIHANVEWAERESVKRALERAGGVKKDAAERLGISQRALSYYLAKYHIE